MINNLSFQGGQFSDFDSSFSPQLRQEGNWAVEKQYKIFALFYWNNNWPMKSEAKRSFTHLIFCFAIVILV